MIGDKLACGHDYSDLRESTEHPGKTYCSRCQAEASARLSQAFSEIMGPSQMWDPDRGWICRQCLRPLNPADGDGGCECR